MTADLNAFLPFASLLLAIAGIVYSAGIQAARILELTRRISCAESRAEPVSPALAQIMERLNSIDRRLSNLESR
jgi:hypothetical protein